jgi:hypothetical protein
MAVRTVESSAQLRHALVDDTTTGIQLQLAGLTAAEQAKWQRRINDQLNACGCREGEIGICVGLFGAAALTYCRRSVTLRGALAHALLSAVVGAAVGKSYGQSRGRRRAHYLCAELSTRLQSPSAAQHTDHRYRPPALNEERIHD